MKTALEIIETIQGMAARIVATNPAGLDLPLIGGFRFRYLDNSIRSSVDIDYHWAGDLDLKQQELLILLQRLLLPEVRRRLQMNGEIRKRSGPDAESPAVRIVDMAFWQAKGSLGRIEISVEITQILCVDTPTVRPSKGVLIPTLSDADMIESKVIAIFNRRELRHRDILDLYLFQDYLLPDSSKRLRAKFRKLHITPPAIHAVLNDLTHYRNHHSRSIQAIVNSQVTTDEAGKLNKAGGGGAILDSTLTLLTNLVPGPQT